MTRTQIAAELHDLAHSIRTYQGDTRMDTATRSDINRALAKAIAYRDCGKQMEVNIWAARLVELLGAERILNDDSHAVQCARNA